MPAHLMSPRARRAALQAALALLEQIAEKHGTNATALQSRLRTKRMVEARREFCIKGVELGFGRTTLGKAINRDQSTVTVHVSPETRAVKRQRWAAWRDKYRPLKQRRQHDDRREVRL